MTVGETSKLSNFMLASKAHIYRFDSSVGRGDFKTAIGVEKVIRGTMTDLRFAARSDSLQDGMRV